jgi:transcriptional regulator with XRE-family HTH domain
MRISKRISQRELAERIGVSSSTVSRVERGESDISLDRFISWCRACDYTFSVWMNNEKIAEVNGE